MSRRGKDCQQFDDEQERKFLKKELGEPIDATPQEIQLEICSFLGNVERVLV